MRIEKKLLYMLYFFPILPCALSGQEIAWEKCYGGNHSEHLFDAIPTADYGFMLAGSSLSNKGGSKKDNSIGNLDYWLWKMDEHGGEDWQRSYGGSGADLLQSIKTTNDGGFILAGSSESDVSDVKKSKNIGLEDFWILKLNAKGGEQWQRTIGGVGADRVKTVISTGDGGFLIGGSSASNRYPVTKGTLPDSNIIYKEEDCRGGQDYWVIKLDKKGNQQWQRTLGGRYDDILESVVATRDGGVLLGGYSNSPVFLKDGTVSDRLQEPKGGFDFWLVKLDSKGTEEWQSNVGGSKNDQLYGMCESKDGNFLLAGSTNSPDFDGGSSARDTDFVIAKVDQMGAVLWSKTLDYGKTDLLASISEDREGNILIGGYSKLSLFSSSKMPHRVKEGINDYIAVKLSADANVLWEKSVGSNGEDILKKIVVVRDGGYLLAGTSMPKSGGTGVLENKSSSRDRKSSNGGNDFWIVKLLDSEKGKKDERSPIIALPNPASNYSNIIIGYDYLKGTATVFDLGGRQLDSFAIDGDRTIPIDLGGYPEGVYIVEIRTGVSTDSVKILKSTDNN